MARAAVIAGRGPIDEALSRKLAAFCARIGPDHIALAPLAVSSPAPENVLLGEDRAFVVSEDAIEVRADFAGSNPIWWAQTPSMFIASRSQRIIAAALSSFEPSREAIAWMLSSGTLGPSHAWDRRVRPLAPGATLRLDRRSFAIEVREAPIVFAASGASDAEHERALGAELEAVFAEQRVERDRWVVPLSGGFDSRALILLASDPRAHRTITWGTHAALSDARTDAAVAKRFAEAMKLEHRYFETDLSAEPIETLMQRYLVAGEGCIDHVSGYFDGFAVWKHLYEAGVEGIIRGDEGFGWVPVASASDVVHSVGLSALGDFANAPSLGAVGLEGVSQALPPALARKPNESLATWRDRLYHAFRIPVVLASLNRLKAFYVGVASPLLDPRLLTLVRAQPDHLRTSKVLFKKLVRARGPDLPFATRSATADPTEVLASRRFRELLADTLSSAANTTFNARALIPRDSRDSLRRRVTRSLKTRAKEVLPVWLRRTLRNQVAPHRLDARTLAFRAFIAARMLSILSGDARS